MFLPAAPHDLCACNCKGFVLTGALKIGALFKMMYQSNIEETCTYSCLRGRNFGGFICLPFGVGIYLVLCVLLEIVLSQENWVFL